MTSETSIFPDLRASDSPAQARDGARVTVRASHLTKRYAVYSKPVDRLKEVLLFRKVKLHREFTALCDVNFEIRRGTTMGVVGPNGAGKSTLLKILAGIISPSEGHVHLTGRVASIIELGSGYHPEFTGNENIYMNAQILGFNHDQIARMYEKIVHFAELGKYLDMPMKTYSSGMFVRLAFSVAIHTEPEILLVDEALAVGDAVFSHRCLRKMRQMRDEGTTIFLVTHDTNTVANFCEEAMFLDRGRLVAQGRPRDVVQRYQILVAERLASDGDSLGQETAFHELGAPQTSGAAVEQRFGTLEARIASVQILNSQNEELQKIPQGAEVVVRYLVAFDKGITSPVFGVMFKNRYGTEIFGTNTFFRKQETPSFSPGDSAVVDFRIKMSLGLGTYALSVAVHTETGYFYDYRVDVKEFEVVGALPSIGPAPLETEVAIQRIEGGAGALSEEEIRRQLYADAPDHLTLGHENLRFLKGTWFQPQEVEGRWARWTGKRAGAYLGAKAAHGRLTMRVRSYKPNLENEPTKGRVVFEGRELGQFSLSEQRWHDLSFDLPSDRSDGPVQISIEVDEVFVPALLHPALQDMRELGVFVERFRLE